MKPAILFGLVIKTHERDRENQQKDLLNSMKSQSFSTYQSQTFRPRDLFPHLKDLIIVLIVKNLDTSMSAHIRISCFESRQWSVRVIHPHVLHALVLTISGEAETDCIFVAGLDTITTVCWSEYTLPSPSLHVSSLVCLKK
jgi:hypothetical protein